MPRSLKPPVAASPEPLWLRPAIWCLAAALVFGYLCRPVGDTDTWWHLKTGQFILEQHHLPVPDPFSWTTYLGKPAYPDEPVTRYFNLTHEWLAQIILYSAWAAGGSVGLILLRSSVLTLFCALAGLMAYRRTQSLYRAIAAALMAAVVTHAFTGDRPQYFTYLFLALAVNLLESRRWLWFLPPLFLIWANCHGGFVLGWVAVGIYCAEALYLRLRHRGLDRDGSLWLAGLTAAVASLINPNGGRVLEVLRNYQSSALQSHVVEWSRPSLWEVNPFTALLYGSVLVLLVNRKRARPADSLLLVVFGAAALMAFRNVIFSGWVGALLVASCLPVRMKATVRPALGWALLAALFVGGVALGSQGQIFQLGHPDFAPATGAADFLAQHHIQGKVFNTYGDGGYLIWRLWPHIQDFTDGRALNENVALDMRRIIFAADHTDGRNWQELLDDYGADIIVMDCFEPMTGAAFYLPAALANTEPEEWHLVFHDSHDLIYMRRPPPDLQPLNLQDGLTAMEQQCESLIADGAPACTKGLVDLFAKIGETERARKWAMLAQQMHLVKGL